MHLMYVIESSYYVVGPFYHVLCKHILATLQSISMLYTMKGLIPYMYDLYRPFLRISGNVKCRGVGEHRFSPFSFFFLDVGVLGVFGNMRTE